MISNGGESSASRLFRELEARLGRIAPAERGPVGLAVRATGGLGQAGQEPGRQSKPEDSTWIIEVTSFLLGPSCTSYSVGADHSREIRKPQYYTS